MILFNIGGYSGARLPCFQLPTLLRSALQASGHQVPRIMSSVAYSSQSPIWHYSLECIAKVPPVRRRGSVLNVGYIEGLNARCTPSEYEEAASRTYVGQAPFVRRMPSLLRIR